MDAALQINPYYGKTSRAGLLSHFNAVLPYGPTIVYNVPARTSQDITPELMLELAAHENFAGVNFDIRRLTLRSSMWLMDHHTSVRQSVAFSIAPGSQEQ